MKTTHIVILALVLVGLFGMVKGIEYLNQDQGKTVVENFVNADTASLDKIELTSISGTNILEKTNEGWKLTAPVEYKANQTNIQTLLTKLDDFKTDNIISTNPENQASFEVNDEKGTKVTLYAGGEQLAQFYVGKAATDYNHTYVRQAGSDEIKTARGSLKTTFGRSTLDWRDKTIYSYEPANIAAVTISAKKQTAYTLSPDQNGTWQIQDQPDTTLDATKVQTLLNSVSAMNCTDFIDDPTQVELDFDVPDLQVILSVANDTLTINLIAQEDIYYAQLANHEQIFEIAPYAFDNLNKQPTDLTASE